MNIFTQNRLFRTCCVGLLALLTGCSESDKIEEPLPQLVDRHQFFYIQDSTLFDFDPATGSSSPVTAIENELSEDKVEVTISSDIGMMLSLDTDESTLANSSELGGSFIDHTVIEEYVVYVKNHSLYVYDLITRFNHNLGKLPEENYFCDIRKVKILDKNPRENDIVLIKDEASIYVKASTEETCLENLSYYRAYFQENPNIDQTYERRTITLKDHTHKHTHEHSHNESDHGHNHLFDEGHIDQNGNIFNSNNHEHGHEHKHELQYGSLEEHDNLTKEEIDQVHNDPNYHEYEFTEHTTLRASFRSAEEALMYSTAPITYGEDLSRFGLLGYDSTSNCLKFFEYDTSSAAAEDPLRFNLWSINLDNPSNFINHNCTLPETPTTNHQVLAHIDTGDGLVVTVNSALYFLSYESIFEDSDTATRASSIRSPLLTGTDISPIYSSVSDTLAIKSDLSVYSLTPPGSDIAPKLLKTYSSEEIEFIDIKFPAQEILVYKRGNQQSCNDNASSCFSLVSLNRSNGSETTILNQSSLQHKIVTIPYKNEIYLHTAHPDRNEIESSELLSNGQTYDSTEFSNAMWGTNVDRREVLDERKYSILRAESDTIIPVDETGKMQLENPDIRVMDQDNLIFAGSVPSNTVNPLNSNIINDFYGTLSLEEIIEGNTINKTYFFPTGRSYINPTGEFGDMKLMYQSIPPSE